MKSRQALMPGCVLLPYDGVPGRCGACGKKLAGRRTAWCSQECSQVYPLNHFWTSARVAALERDEKRCVKCGWADDFFDSHLRNGQIVIWSRANLNGQRPMNRLEVNHIVPRVGGGYGTGCWNHLDGLETLCRKCHVKVTNRQRIDRARAA